jgi:hypothetical protein
LNLTEKNHKRICGFKYVHYRNKILVGQLLSIWCDILCVMCGRYSAAGTLDEFAKRIGFILRVPFLLALHRPFRFTACE